MAAPESALAPAISVPTGQHGTLDRMARWLAAGYLALAVVLFIAYPLLAYGWLQRPFLGAFVEPTFVFNEQRSQSNADWPLAAAGVTFPDRLLAIDGRPIRTDTEFAAALDPHRPGEVVTVSVEKVRGIPGAGFESLGTRDTVVTLQAFPSGDLFRFFIVPYFLGLAFLATGVWVFRLRHAEVAGRAFAGFCAATAIMIGGLFDVYTTHTLAWAWTIAVPLAGALLFILGLTFPKEARLLARRPWLRWLSLIPLVLIGLNSSAQLYNRSQPHAYAGAWEYGYLFAGFGAAFFLGMSVYRWRSADSPVIREQSKLVLLGSLGFVPATVWVIAILTTPTSIPFRGDLYFTPLVLFPLAIAYAILRYRLLNTDLILTQAMIYATLGILTIFGYAILVAGVSVITGNLIAANSPALMGLLVFLLAIAFNPLRTWLQRQIDMTFFRGQRAYRQQLADFGRALTESTELPDIVRTVRECVQLTIGPAHLHVFLRATRESDYAAYSPDGKPETDIQFEPTSPLAETLATRRSVVYFSPVMPLPAPLQADRPRLAVLGSTLYIPLASKESLAGWLALGPRLSGEPYHNQDIHFLETLAIQASLAVERAQVILDLERRVNELNVLSQVSQAVNFTIEFDDLLELIYAQASRVLDTSNFHIVLHDRRTETLRYAFFVEDGERLREREDQPWPDDVGLVGEVVRIGRPVLADSYLDECTRREVIPLNRAYHAWMGVPLNAGSGTLGALSIASKIPGQTLSLEQMTIFGSIADQAAAAIDKAQLYQEVQDRAHQLQTLNEVSQALTSTLDLDELLTRIVTSAVELLDCEAGSLFLTEETTGDHIFRVTVGAGEDLIGTRVPAGQGLVGAAATSNEPVMVNNARTDKRWFANFDEETGFVTRAVLAAPLRGAERNVGVIEVINKRDRSPFTEEDQTLLVAYSSQAAVSIENAHLYTMIDQALAARVEELSQMQQIDRELNAGLDINRVMSIALERALQVSGAKAGFVGYVLEEGVEILVHQGYPQEALRPYLEQPLPRGEGLIGRVLETSEHLLVSDVTADPDYIAIIPDTRAQLTIPLRHEERNIGVIVLESNSAEVFGEDNVDFMVRLADHAAIAVANARLYREVQQANLAKSEFMSFVAHELKNPMTSIKGYAELMEKGAVGSLTDVQGQFVGTIRSNVDRMSTIVSDLADIARIESGRLRLEETRCDFRDLLEEVVRSTQGQFDSKHQTLTIEVEPNLPPVWADQARTVQILTNLVSNAHKYTAETGRISILVRTAANKWDPDGAPEVLHVTVEDNGIGIAETEQKSIFTQFFRSENPIVSEIPGTGLGLNIVKLLVELQGGRAWFRSELGVGSTFHFTIPLASAVPSMEGDPRATAEPQG